MIAEKMMNTDLQTTKDDDLVAIVFAQMRDQGLRMLPVVDDNHCVVGIISTFDVLQHIVPDYLLSGDLSEISYAPDIGVLQRNYSEVVEHIVRDVMNTQPLMVRPEDSLLSVAAILCGHGRHEYALVVDKTKHLLGIISAGDILSRLKQKESETNHA